MLTICKYRFLCLIRNKSLIFWNLAFPLILTTFFGLTLKQAYNYSTLESIPVAVVESEAMKQDKAFIQTLEQLKQDDVFLFQVTYTTEEKAAAMLKQDEIDGYIKKDDTLQAVVKASDINQTILQTFLNEYVQKTSQVTHMLSLGATSEQLQTLFHKSSSYVKSKEQSNTDLSSVFFYTVIGMCAMYGAYISLRSMQDIQANLSPAAARNSMAPTSKAKLLFSDFLISYLVHFIILLIIFCYMIYVVQVDFGEHTGYIILLIMAGVMAGNALGTMVGVLSKKSLDTNTGIVTAVVMSLSFLSGMMMVQMKWIVQQYIPLLAMINPVNMITDGLYALYYYGVNERFFFNLISLLIFTVICYAVSYVNLRRKQYASL